MAWKDLSIAQRSQLMNIYRRAGITDLYRMKEMYDASSPSFPDGGNSLRIGNPYGNLYEEGGDKDILKIKQQWAAKQSAEQASLDKYFKGFPYQKPTVFSDGYVQGVDDITDWVKDGYEGLYNKDFATSNYKYYRGKDGKIYRVANSENINTAGLTPMDYSELRKMLPKRDYIGGNDYRFKTMQRIPGFVDYVSQRAKAYGVDPNLILRRIGKEGWIDQIVQQYNGLNASQQNDTFWSGLWDLPVGGFGSFGLDDAGSNLMSGKYTLLDPNATWEETEAMNEKGRIVHSIRTENLKSALEIKAAEMAYRQREAAKKYGKSGRDLNIWTNAAFNMGLNHPKLADDDYIRRNYSYPDYLGASLQKKFGGILHAFDGGKDIQYYAKGGNICIKPENRGKFTALKKRTGHSASWFKENGTPAQKKMAVFALNARKWKHGDGGLIERYGPDAVRSALQTVKANRFGDGGDTEEEYYGVLPASVVTASLPAKFHGSQEAARRYAEGYKFGKRVAQGRDEFANEWVAPAVIGLSAGPAGAIAGLAGRMVDVGVNALTGGDKNTWGDLFVSPQKHPWLNLAANFTNPGYLVAGPLSKGLQNDLTSLGREAVGLPAETVKATADVPVASELQKPQVVQALAPQASYEIADLGGGYMLKSLMRGNPLEKQISKQGTVSVNNIKALMNKGSKVEQAVVDKVLASEEFAGKKAIDYNKFRKAVQDELITYDRTPDTRYNDYGMERIGVLSPEEESFSNEFNKAKDYLEKHPELDMFVDQYGNVYSTTNTASSPFGDELLEPIGDIHSILDARFPEWRKEVTPLYNIRKETFTFSSPRIPGGSGRHYDANTLGHSRTYTTADEPDVLHVMESQSDWAQSHPKYMVDYSKEPWFNPEDPVHQSLVDGANSQRQYLVDNYTSRQIQENLRYAAEKGQKKMRYPTRETAAKIEGYPEQINYYDKNGFKVNEPYEYPENVAKRIESIQNEIDKIDLDDLDTFAPFEIVEGSFTWGSNSGEVTNAKLLAKLRDRIFRDRDSLNQMQRYGDDNNMVAKRLDDREKLFDKQVAKYKEKYGHEPELDVYSSKSREAKARRAILQPELGELLGSGPTQLKKGLIEKKEYFYEDILRKYTEFPKQFKKLYKNADVRTVTDLKGNTWYEVDVPQDYLKQEWAYGDGGALNNPLIGIGILMD